MGTNCASLIADLFYFDMKENIWPLVLIIKKLKLHGRPMLVDNTNFGLVLYNHANFYRFEETSSVIGQLNKSSFSLLFIGQPATHLRHHSV